MYDDDGVAGDGVRGQGDANDVLGLGKMAGDASDDSDRPGLLNPRSDADVASPSSSSSSSQASPPTPFSASESLLPSAFESGERVSPTLPALPRLSSECSASSPPSMYRMHFFFLLPFPVFHFRFSFCLFVFVFRSVRVRLFSGFMKMREKGEKKREKKNKIQKKTLNVELSLRSFINIKIGHSNFMQMSQRKQMNKGRTHRLN